MIKKLKQNILNEMNKTLLPDDVGYIVGVVNNTSIVNKMSIWKLLMLNRKIEQRYKQA